MRSPPSRYGPYPTGGRATRWPPRMAAMDANELRELGQQFRVDSIRPAAVAKSGHPTSGHVRRRPDGRAGREPLRYDFDDPKSAGERPADLLEGPRVDAVLRDPPRGRGDHRRGAAHVPQVRQHARGASDSAHPVGRRRDGLARPGPADRRRDGARREIPRPAPFARLGALRRQRDGGGIDVGGVRACVALRARQSDRDHRRQPARPARRDDDRLEHGRLRRTRARLRLERDRGRRSRRRGDRPRLQGGRRRRKDARR